MNEQAIQLVGLLLAGALVHLGAREPLRRFRWGETVWRISGAALVAAGLIGGWALTRG